MTGEKNRGGGKQKERRADENAPYIFAESNAIDGTAMQVKAEKFKDETGEFFQ